MGYDAVAHRTIAGGPLAVRPMSELRALTGGVLSAQRLSDAEVELLLATAWQIPDPATTARPLADLPRLFAGLRERGLKIAIATSDDRAATLATLTQLRVAQMVDVVIAADDGVPLKPKPDMVWVACQATQVAPRQAIVVGDAWPELQMARAAQAGLAIGVTSGVSNADMLAALADVIMTNVDELLA